MSQQKLYWWHAPALFLLISPCSMSFTGKTYHELERCFSRARELNVSPFELLSREAHKEGRMTSREDGDAAVSRDRETYFVATPPFINGTMKEYQIEGLNWLISLHEHGLNGILADEMGLGKTLQTLAFLAYLKTAKKTRRPVLVLVPKSTLENWQRECRMWTPTLSVALLTGTKEERGETLRSIHSASKDKTCIDLFITSYEIAIREKCALGRMQWSHIVIDEAHRIKNERSLLSQVTRVFACTSRLLITGTPLQNNLHELWALLNFLFPQLFHSSDEFEGWFSGNGDGSPQSQEWKAQQLRKMLEPFLLRRTKEAIVFKLPPKHETNLYVGLSDMQRVWYRHILARETGLLMESRDASLLNILMQLRKCCNHPYLFPGAEPEPHTTGECLITDSQKMVVLDKLLARLKARGSRVLLFSQMSRMLDILEDYCTLRGYEYCRLDGTTSHDERIENIDRFNAEGSTFFVFLLTTRSGGLGINLATADTVVLYDSDWNPQADLQAQARAHRIGQKKPVAVFRLVTTGTVEEKILEKAQQKLRLDQIVIQSQTGRLTQTDLRSIIAHGLSAADGEAIPEDDIDTIIRSGEEKTRQLQSRFVKMGLDDLNNYMRADFETSGKGSSAPSLAILHPSPGRRRTARRTRVDPPAEVKAFHLPSEELVELVCREELLYMKECRGEPVFLGRNMLIYPQCHGKTSVEIRCLAEDTQPLSHEERQRKKLLLKDLFLDWSKAEFNAFLNFCIDEDSAALKASLHGKTGDDIRRYAKAFDLSRHLFEKERAKIKKAKRKLKGEKETNLLIKKYLKSNATLKSSHGYSPEEDRFILEVVSSYEPMPKNIHRHLKHAIHACDKFELDYFIRTRTPADLKKRTAYLLEAIVARAEDGQQAS
eukprot:GHVN01081424.1.p1 GENE.GHVN01081424.1~~GHVN01081424.1.p1  ORF type:complete len:886 (+),score=90.77 GHVN01081424.1:4604-7261(+)